jgi:hypothetical protein
MRKILPILVVFSLFLGGCASATTPTAGVTPATPAATAPATTSYPGPDTKAQDTTVYPAPAQQQPLQQATDAYPAPQSNQAAGPQAYPPETTTGIAIIDQVIKAGLAADHSALAGLVHFSTLACTQKEGLGGPPKCLASEPEGTQVEVLPFLGAEGSHVRKADVSADSFKGQYALLAAFKVKTPAHADPDFPAGKYAVVFKASGADQSTGIVTLHLDDQGIIRLDSEGGVSDTILSQVEEFLLPFITK